MTPGTILTISAATALFLCILVFRRKKKMRGLGKKAGNSLRDFLLRAKAISADAPLSDALDKDRE